MARGASGGYGNGTVGQPGGTPALADATGPTLLRAGCSGQLGGTGTINPSPGSPGVGGGAIYIVAGSNLTLSATSIINVSGSGGFPALARGGGGGGGAGGMIVLYAPAISGSGTKLVANGGAGSTGAGTSSITGSPAGEDPNPSSPNTSAAGVAGPEGTGTGGGGYSTSAAALPGGDAATYGGGGGAGYIQSNVAISGSITSPALTVVP
jgi:hypothetical protein